MPARARSGARIMPPVTRTLALLTRFRGAKRGANDRRHRATPGHVRPLVLARNGTLGHIRRCTETLRKCLLSSRSRVRVAVGAQMVQLDLFFRKTTVLRSYCSQAVTLV